MSSWTLATGRHRVENVANASTSSALSRRVVRNVTDGLNATMTTPFHPDQSRSLAELNDITQTLDKHTVQPQQR